MLPALPKRALIHVLTNDHIQLNQENNHATESARTRRRTPQSRGPRPFVRRHAHGKGDHLTGHELSRKAHEYSVNAHKYVEELVGKVERSNEG
jgi:hypothetical protein